MNEDTIKLAAIGFGGLLIGMLFFGRGKGGRSDPGIEATLESMRISSQTNIAYGNIGVESQRIQASLAAEKDKNHSSIQLASIESASVKHAVDRRAQTENYRIATDKSKFFSQLSYDLESMTRWLRVEKFKIGKQANTDKITAGNRLREKKLENDTIRYAASKNAAVQFGSQSNDSRAMEQSYLLALLQASGGIMQGVGRGVGDIYGAFTQPTAGYYGGGSGMGDYRYAEGRGFPRGSGSSGMYTVQPGSSQGSTGFEDDGPSGASIGRNVASGAAMGAAVGGPYGAVAGAAAGAGSSFS